MLEESLPTKVTYLISENTWGLVWGLGPVSWWGLSCVWIPMSFEWVEEIRGLV